MKFGFRGIEGDTMKTNMEYKFCKRCNCLQWMFVWIEGILKYYECPDCGAVIKEEIKKKVWMRR